MTIGRDDVRRIARLAGLELDPTDESLVESLQSILDYVALLDELDVDEVPPTSFGAVAGTSVREDEPQPGLTADEAVKNAPDSVAGQFRVPSVLER